MTIKQLDTIVKQLERLSTTEIQQVQKELDMVILARATKALGK
jgi:hypothetical protein